MSETAATERGVEVRLTVAEFVGAAHCGLMRVMTSVGRGDVDYPRHAGAHSWLRSLYDNALGACAERAVAKARSLYWDGSVDTFHTRPDVADLEVRATEDPRGSLIVRPQDAADRWYVLVTGQPPSLTIRGAIWGADAQRDEWQRDPSGRGPAWFVPQSALHTPGGTP